MIPLRLRISIVAGVVFFSSLWLAVFEAAGQDGTLQRLLLFVLFRLLPSSSLLSVQRFGRCALRPSSGISCRTQEPSCNREPSRNFEPNPLFSPWGYPLLILLTIAGVQVLSCVNYYSMLLLPLTRIEPAV